jgi:hypothetical protein
MLATKPTFTGSAPIANTMGIVVVAALAASAAARRQALKLIVRPTIFDRDGLAFDEARLTQSLAEALKMRPITAG